MPVFETTISCPAPADVVSDFMADFRHCADWDPGVSSAELLSGEPTQQGARFRVVAGGFPLVYELREHRGGAFVELYGTHPVMVSLDQITITPRADGSCDTTYRAQVDLRGPLRVFHPIFGPVFQRVGGRAGPGLTRALNALPATTP
jgi:hypothetical protein